ncbi:MAG: hypothetical protein DRQ54_11445 [Gammaproteobacteria bacterium]|nr:MAG: hypothetical protein DRQ54_11445 [Gammaproteobacteria bacterium]
MRLSILAIALCLTQACALANNFEILESYSNRAVPTGWVPPGDGYQEGSIVGTFVSSEPAEIVSGGLGFVQLSQDTWQRTFTWDEDQPAMAVFRSLESSVRDTIWAFPVSAPALAPGAHEYPIWSLQTDPSNIWSDAQGLYVWGDYNPNWNQRGIEWERTAQLEVWEADGTPVMSRNIGLRINGGWTRGLPQKSWRLYFDHHQDPVYLYHDFFGDGPTVSQRLLLRQTMMPQYLLTDHWATSMYRELGHLTSRWTPSVAYLNGEYWGIYSLRERLDDKWATVSLGYDPQDVILFKDGETEHGDPDAWHNFLNWVNEWSDPSDHNFFVGASQRLNLQAYTDWIIINAFTANSENGFRHNLAILRQPDQRWNYVMWDEDDILYPQNLQAQLLRFYSAGSYSEYEEFRPPLSYFESYSINLLYCRLFRQLMGNAEYRTFFRDRADILLDGVLEISNAQARFDSLVVMFEPELPPHARRYPGSGLWNLTEAAADYQDFIALRQPVFVDHLSEFLADFMAPVELSHFSTTTQDDNVILHWQTERERDNEGFEVWRAVADSMALELLATSEQDPGLVGSPYSDDPLQYSFVDTETPAESVLWYQLRHADINGDTIVHQWLVQTGPAPLPDLVINEFLASNSFTNPDAAG